MKSYNYILLLKVKSEEVVLYFIGLQSLKLQMPDETIKGLIELFKLKQNHRNHLVNELLKKYCNNEKLKIPNNFPNSELQHKINKNKNSTLSAHLGTVFNWQLNRTSNFIINQKENNIKEFENEREIKETLNENIDEVFIYF